MMTYPTPDARKMFNYERELKYSDDGSFNLVTYAGEPM